MSKKNGVLYVRYSKDSSYGRLIEELKKDHRYCLNTKILQLLFLSEIVEKIDPDAEIGVELQNEYCYESLKFFSRKLALVRHQIELLTEKSIVQ